MRYFSLSPSPLRLGSLLDVLRGVFNGFSLRYLLHATSLLGLLWLASGAAHAATIPTFPAVGIIGATPPDSTEPPLQGIQPESLTVAAELLRYSDYVIDLDTDGVVSPQGHWLDVETRLRYCSTEALAANTSYWLRLQLKGANWEQNTGATLYLEEGNAHQPVLADPLLQDYVDFNASFSAEVLLVSTSGQRSSSDPSVLILEIESPFPIPMGACFTLAYGEVEIVDEGLIIGSFGSPSIKILQGASGVEVIGSLYELTASSAIQGGDTSQLEITPTQRYIEILPQYEFKLSQPAEVQLDRNAALPYSRLVEEGAADDVLSSDNDADLFAAAATFALWNQQSRIEESINIESTDGLILNLQANPATLLARPNSGFFEFDNSGPTLAGNPVALVPSADGGLQGIAPLMSLTGNFMSDDLVLNLPANQAIEAHSWSLSAEISLQALATAGVPGIVPLYASPAASPAFNFTLPPASAGFMSSPAPGSTLDFGGIELGQTSSGALRLSEGGDADLEISIASTAISGLHAGDFSLLTPLPTLLNIPDGGSSLSLEIQCKPSAVGTRSAILTLQTNDPNWPKVNYPLTCVGIELVSGLTTLPQPGSTLFVPVDDLSNPGTLALTLLQTGTTDTLVKDIQISGADAAYFLLEGPALPLTLGVNRPETTFLLSCDTRVAPLPYLAALTVFSNDPQQAEITYPLVCGHNKTGAAGYSSAPAVASPLLFDAQSPGDPARFTLFVVENGDQSLLLENPRILGLHATDFKLATTFPVKITDGAPPQPLSIDCSPGGYGQREAELRFDTNDPAFPQVSYPLLCQGAIPQPPTDILLSASSIAENAPGGTLIGELSALDADAPVGEVPVFTLLEDAGGRFTIEGSQLQLAPAATLDYEQQTGFDILVRVTDSSNLSLDKKFTIQIENVIDVTFSGRIYAGSGANGVYMTSDAPENVNLFGYIEPDASHFGQLAEVEVDFNFVSNTAQRYQWRLALGAQSLQPGMEFELFDGKVLHLTGNFSIVMRYILPSGRSFSAEIAGIEVLPNRPPQDILLSNQTIKENSPPGTLIGVLSTLDEDVGETFRYAVTQNAGSPAPYFKIEGNELRLAQSFPLLYAEQSAHQIKILSVDASGDSIEKSFIISVTDEVQTHFSGELRNGDLVLLSEPLVAGDNWPVSAHALIQPDQSHVGISAAITLDMSYTSLIGENTLSSKTLADNLVLPDWLDLTLLQGPLAAGDYALRVGYQLLNSAQPFAVSQEILRFRVEPSTGSDSLLEVISLPCQDAFIQPPLYNLAQNARFGSEEFVFLERVNDLSLLSESGLQLQQDPELGYLLVDDATHSDDLLRRYAWQAYAIINSGEEAGVLFETQRQTLSLTVPPGFSLIGQPAVQAPCSLQNSVRLPIQVKPDGDLKVGNGKLWYSLRPEWLATGDLNHTLPGLFLYNHPLLPALGAVVHVFSDPDLGFLAQRFYPTPAQAEALFNDETAAHYDASGLLHFEYGGEVYSGLLDIIVTTGTERPETLQVESIADQNGDYISDYRLLYPNGEQQILFAFESL